jgi:hypothetical protein
MTRASCSATSRHGGMYWGPTGRGSRVFLTPWAYFYLLPYDSNSGIRRSHTDFTIVLTPLTP